MHFSRPWRSKSPVSWHCDRLVNFVRSQRVSVVTLSSTFSEKRLCRMGCPRPDSVALGSYGRPRGGSEAPGGGGVASGAKQGRRGASAAGYLWISGLGASSLASLGGSLHSRCRSNYTFFVEVIFTFCSWKVFWWSFSKLERRKQLL